MLVGVTVGPVVRAVVVLGAGAGVFLAAREGGDTTDLGHPLKFWLWLLFAYLVTLVAETALLIRAAGEGRRFS